MTGARKKRTVSKGRDAMGDPLPRSALARIGTARFDIDVSSTSVLRWSPDGLWLATGTVDGHLDLRTGDGHPHARLRIGKSRARGGAVRSLAFTPDSRSVLFGSNDRIAVVDLESGVITRELASGVFDQFGLVAGGTCVAMRRGMETVAVDVASGSMVWRAPVVAEAWMALEGDRTLAVDPIALAVIDAAGAVVRTIATRGGAHPHPGTNARVWRDGAHVTQVTSTGVAVADLERGGLVAWHAWPDAIPPLVGAERAAPMGDGRVVVSDDRGRLRFFDARTGVLGEPFARGEGALTITDDDARITAAGPSVRHFDGEGAPLDPMPHVRRLLGFRGDAIAWIDADDVLRWSASDGRPLRAWSVEAAEPLDTDAAQRTVVARERECPATWRERGHAYWGRCFEIDGTVRCELPSAGARMLAPDGSIVVTRAQDGTLVVRDLALGATRATLATRGKGVYGLAISSDARTVAADDARGAITVWSASDGRCLATLARDRAIAWSIAFSPDGSRLVAGYGSGAVCLWDIASGYCVRELAGQRHPTPGVAWSPDGTLVAASARSETRVWSVQTGTELARLAGGGNAVSFGPSSRLLVSGADYTTRAPALIWDLSSLAP